ncbi:hypothetical protein MPH_11418 [Macrophomina phaseolina MS6]|uniref:Uncharacterized protein n=1 Tax=Macrophomina phaseolina (strain MS6) TaxID=1126212 RepID=K2RAA3_MACPH|nr:hypothetical protein MPH_11418 [Macrophomina phaseolina MS6]
MLSVCTYIKKNWASPLCICWSSSSHQLAVDISGSVSGKHVSFFFFFLLKPDVSHDILITGVSGYLGGTLLAHFQSASLPNYGNLFGLVRKPEQAEAIKQYGAEPLMFSPQDEQATKNAIMENKITIVYFLLDAYDGTSQVNIIKALAECKNATGLDVHFLHVSSPKSLKITTGRLQMPLGCRQAVPRCSRVSLELRSIGLCWTMSLACMSSTESRRLPMRRFKWYATRSYSGHTYRLLE